MSCKGDNMWRALVSNGVWTFTAVCVFCMSGCAECDPCTSIRTYDSCDKICRDSGMARPRAICWRNPDRDIRCPYCYRRAVIARDTYPCDVSCETVEIHRCPVCEAWVKTYSRDGRTYIQCSRCVPTNTACDRCKLPGHGQ